MLIKTINHLLIFFLVIHVPFFPLAICLLGSRNSNLFIFLSSRNHSATLTSHATFHHTSSSSAIALWNEDLFSDIFEIRLDFVVRWSCTKDLYGGKMVFSALFLICPLILLNVLFAFLIAVAYWSYVYMELPQMVLSFFLRYNGYVTAYNYICISLRLSPLPMHSTLHWLMQNFIHHFITTKSTWDRGTQLQFFSVTFCSEEILLSVDFTIQPCFYFSSSRS